MYKFVIVCIIRGCVCDLYFHIYTVIYQVSGISITCTPLLLTTECTAVWNVSAPLKWDIFTCANFCEYWFFVLNLLGKNLWLAYHLYSLVGIHGCIILYMCAYRMFKVKC